MVSTADCLKVGVFPNYSVHASPYVVKKHDIDKVYVEKSDSDNCIMIHSISAIDSEKSDPGDKVEYSVREETPPDLLIVDETIQCDYEFYPNHHANQDNTCFEGEAEAAAIVGGRHMSPISF